MCEDRRASALNYLQTSCADQLHGCGDTWQDMLNVQERRWNDFWGKGGFLAPKLCWITTTLRSFWFRNLRSNGNPAGTNGSESLRKYQKKTKFWFFQTADEEKLKLENLRRFCLSKKENHFQHKNILIHILTKKKVNSVSNQTFFFSTTWTWRSHDLVWSRLFIFNKIFINSSCQTNSNKS